MSLSFTIVTLRFNRSQFFARYVEYSRSHGIQSIVVDGSEEPFCNAALPDNIDYIHLPGQGFLERLSYAMSRVKTPNVLIQADDDFVCTESLEQASTFLDNNPDYSAVTGQVLIFDELYTKSSIRFYKYRFADDAFPQEHNQVSERLEKHLDKYMFTFYSMQRTSVWREFCHVVAPTLSGYDAFRIIKPAIFELTQSIFCLACGKVKMLEQPWLVREYFATKKRVKNHNQAKSSPYSFNSTESFSSYLNAFIGLLHSSEQVASDNLAESLKNGFNRYVARLNERRGQSALESIGDTNLVSQLFCETRSSQKNIFSLIDKYRDEIKHLFYSSGNIHPDYWYDQVWASDIVTRYLDLTQGLDDFVLFGAGEHTAKLLDLAGETHNLVGVTDNDSSLWGQRLFSVECYSPARIMTISRNVIISSQDYEHHISEQLLKMYGSELNVFKLYGVAG